MVHQFLEPIQMGLAREPIADRTLKIVWGQPAMNVMLATTTATKSNAALDLSYVVLYASKDVQDAS